MHAREFYYDTAVSEGMFPSTAARFCRLIDGLILDMRHGGAAGRHLRTEVAFTRYVRELFDRMLEEQRRGSVGAALARVFRPSMTLDLRECSPMWDDTEPPVLGPMKVTWITTEEARRRWP